MVTDKEVITIRKAQFFYSMNLKCHIKLKGVGFRNGWFISNYIPDGSYFHFKDIRFPERIDRVFLDEIFDIKDYVELEAGK